MKAGGRFRWMVIITPLGSGPENLRHGKAGQGGRDYGRSSRRQPDRNQNAQDSQAYHIRLQAMVGGLEEEDNDG
jgi:hypothetical protein